MRPGAGTVPSLLPHPTLASFQACLRHGRYMCVLPGGWFTSFSALCLPSTPQSTLSNISQPHPRPSGQSFSILGCSVSLLHHIRSQSWVSIASETHPCPARRCPLSCYWARPGGLSSAAGAHQAAPAQRPGRKLFPPAWDTVPQILSWLGACQDFSSVYRLIVFSSKAMFLNTTFVDIFCRVLLCCGDHFRHCRK